MMANLVPGQSLLPGLQAAPSDCVFTRQRASLVSSSFKIYFYIFFGRARSSSSHSGFLPLQ